jgi:microcystin-dependent protein
MAWPSTPIPTTNLDDGTDSPAAARPGLLTAVQAVNLMQSEQLPPVQGGFPTGGFIPFAGTVAPSGWLMCYGQSVSRSSYAALFSVIGTSYGSGDGSTTFNVPDLRGRTTAGKDDMGGTAAGVLNVTLSGMTTAGSAVVTGLSSTAGLAVGMSAIGANIPAGRTIASIDSATQVTLSSGTSVTAGTASIRFGVIDGATLGATGGTQVHTLATTQMPAHTHTVAALATLNPTGGGSTTMAYQGGNTTMASNSTGGGQAHPNVQPTIIANYIIKT